MTGLIGAGLLLSLGVSATFAQEAVETPPQVDAPAQSAVRDIVPDTAPFAWIGDLARAPGPGPDASSSAVVRQGMAYEGQDPRFDLFGEAIDAAPGVVAEGHRRQSFPAKGQLWREVLACRSPGGILGDVAPERICFVCSIDDIGGMRVRDDTAPATAVSIRSSYAFLQRDDEGRWRLREWEPFGSNRYARNGHYRHRASVRWIREAAVGECYDLQAVNGRLNIY